MILASSITGFITDWVTAAIGDGGLYAVFALMLLDAVFPAASELVMVYSGALAAGAFTSNVVLFGHEFEPGLGAFTAMVAAGTVGYTIGAVLGWAIGVYGGRPYLDRHGRWLHLPPHRLDRAEQWFERWGQWASFVGRVTPVARSFVSIPAGVFHARLAPYTVLTFVGSTLWCLLFAAVGYGFGTRWETFHENFHYVDYAVAAGIVLGVAYLLVRRRRSVNSFRNEASSPGRDG